MPLPLQAVGGATQAGNGRGFDGARSRVHWTGCPLRPGHMVGLGFGGVSEQRVQQEADQEAIILQPVDWYKSCLQSNGLVLNPFRIISTSFLSFFIFLRCFGHALGGCWSLISVPATFISPIFFAVNLYVCMCEMHERCKILTLCITHGELCCHWLPRQHDSHCMCVCI